MRVFGIHNCVFDRALDRGHSVRLLGVRIEPATSAPRLGYIIVREPQPIVRPKALESARVARRFKCFGLFSFVRLWKRSEARWKLTGCGRKLAGCGRKHVATVVPGFPCVRRRDARDGRSHRMRQVCTCTAGDIHGPDQADS